jgi:hypothetical protein
MVPPAIDLPTEEGMDDDRTKVDKTCGDKCLAVF